MFTFLILFLNKSNKASSFVEDRNNYKVTNKTETTFLAVVS